MEELLTMLNDIRLMSTPLVNYLLSVIEAFELRKKQFLLKKGMISNHIYYVSKGILRGYYEDENKKQTTKWFMDEGNVITSVDSFFSRTPTLEPIQAIEPSLLFGIRYEQLYHAYEHYPEFNYHGRELTQKYHVLNERRISALQCLRARERYLYTKETQPRIVERVSDNLLASYLGIKKETLSRIKNSRL
ncbi:MAG TPA: Crp/Fnr family transcriptional regulator [Puia sp.]|nr:Crp/Fnr family transcriptional regulator [Puia sp.]